MPLTSEHSSVCGRCTKQRPLFSKVLAYAVYEGALSEAIHQFKFCGLKRLSGPLGRFLLQLDIPEADGFVPVPLSKRALKNRGFNQSLLLARVISKALRLPVLMDVLFKRKDTPPQIGLSSRERLSNLRDAFEVRGDVQDLRLLLVDDVITTGATVTACTKALFRAGAREVTVITLARAGLD